MTDQRDSIIAAAQALSRQARELEVATNAARQIPAELIEAFHRSGLLRILQPKQFGGMEATLVDMIDVADIIGRGCGSAGWVYAVFASHVLTLACFPEETQREIWEGHPQHVASSAYNPNPLIRVPGGFRTSGKWSFMSGIDHAQWCIILGEVDEGPGKPPTAYTCVVPKSDVTILDDWYVMGMTGTGSKSIVAKDIFIPERRTVAFLDTTQGDTPGGRFHSNPLYRCPRLSCTGYVLAAVVMGIAEGFIDRFVAHAHTRRRRPATSGTMADQHSMQLRVAQSAGEVDAARLLLRRNCIETHETLQRGESLPDELRGRNRRDNALVSMMSVEAVNRLFTAAGAHAVLEAAPLASAFRDIQTGQAQTVLNFESAGTSYGRIRMGLPPDDSWL